MANRTCSLEGCGKPHYGRGWCMGHWSNWRRTGNPVAFARKPPAAEPDLPGESWLPVPGWEGLYEVSDKGRIRSLPRKTVSGWRGGNVLKPGLDTRGYFFVILTYGRRREQFTVHALVAAAFIGPRPEGADVCHGRMGKHCNEPGNLRYDTRQGNILDSVLRDRTHANAAKECCPLCGSGYVLRGGRRYCPTRSRHTTKAWIRGH